MRLKEIDHINDGGADIYFVNIYQNIQRFVPEFLTSFEKDEQYMIMFEFGEFIMSKKEDDLLLKKCANFINDAIEYGTSITYELLALELFVVFFENNDRESLLQSKLSNDANIVFGYFEYMYNKKPPTILKKLL